MLINLMKICYNDKLNNIFNNQNILAKIFDNTNNSLSSYNPIVKFLIIIFLLLVIFINLFYIILFFYKFQLNHFSISRDTLCKIPYCKKINDFILANLLLHYE